MNAEQIDVLLKVIAVLNQLGVRYAIGGSFASSAHGFPRATRDIDLIVEISPAAAKDFAEKIASVLQPNFYADEYAIAQAIRWRKSFNVIHEETFVKIDLFVIKPSEFHAQQLERRQLEMIGVAPNETAYIVTAEDIILAKLDWYREGGCVSEQQWRDIAGVIRVQADRLDYNYLREWAAKLEVSDLLEQALEQSLSE